MAWPEVQSGNGGFGYRNHQTQPGPFRQPYDRHGLRIRCRAGLDERARIRVALGYNSAEGSRNAGVRFERGVAIHSGLGHVKPALCFRQRGASAADLRFGAVIVGHRVVEFLFGN